MIANTPQAWSERARVEAPWEAALWSEQGQKLRFQAVLRHLDLQVGDTLLDFGCGTGEFHASLPLWVQYHGLDWADGMRERAGVRPGVYVHDELPDMMFDHIIAVGPFNLADNWTKEATKMQLLELWHEYTRTTLVVCFYRGDDPNCLTYRAEDLVEMARLSGCHRFSVDATYLDNDLLLEMRR